ncbi:MAG: c-type cytochrome [Caldilineaceae bacterium]
MLQGKRLLLLLVVLLMALGAIAGCGGGDDEGADSAANAEAVAAAPAAPVGDAAKGQEIFDVTCIACHGPGGIGVQGLGKSMVTSTFISGLTDEELVTFIKAGRDPGHPDNTTGVAMPPKGGNPAITDEQLVDVVAYIRTLHE